VPEAEQHGGTARERGVAPRRERRGGRPHGLVDLAGSCEVDGRLHGTGGRVEHVPGAFGGPAPRLARDPVGDVLGHERTPCVRVLWFRAFVWFRAGGGFASSVGRGVSAGVQYWGSVC